MIDNKAAINQLRAQQRDLERRLAGSKNRFAEVHKAAEEYDKPAGPLGPDRERVAGGKLDQVSPVKPLQTRTAGAGIGLHRHCAITLDEVIRATSRLPFTESEIHLALNYFEIGQRKGRDLILGCRDGFPWHESDLLDLANEGIMCFSSRMLSSEFIFLKVDAGRSLLFGRQRSVFSSYVGDAALDELMAGPVFRVWLLAVTSIGNVYRGAGFL